MIDGNWYRLSKEAGGKSKLTPEQWEQIAEGYKQNPTYKFVNELSASFGISKSGIMNFLTVKGLFTPPWIANMDPALLTQIEDAFKNGMNLFEAYKAFPMLKPRQVQMIKDRAQITFTPDIQRKRFEKIVTPEMQQKIVFLRAQNKSIWDIAMEMGIRKAQVEQALSYYNPIQTDTPKMQSEITKKLWERPDYAKTISDKNRQVWQNRGGFWAYVSSLPPDKASSYIWSVVKSNNLPADQQKRMFYAMKTKLENYIKEKGIKQQTLRSVPTV